MRAPRTQTARCLLRVKPLLSKKEPRRACEREGPVATPADTELVVPTAFAPGRTFCLSTLAQEGFLEALPTSGRPVGIASSQGAWRVLAEQSLLCVSDEPHLAPGPARPGPARPSRFENCCGEGTTALHLMLFQQGSFLTLSDHLVTGVTTLLMNCP